jgi:hypothetical protein
LLKLTAKKPEFLQSDKKVALHEKIKPKMLHALHSKVAEALKNPFHFSQTITNI